MSAIEAVAPGVRGRSHPALWVLLAFTFSLGVGEFVVMGLLPEVAASLGVGIPAAGWLVTGYALGIAVGGPILVVSTLRVPRRSLLVALGAVFALATAVCALAPSHAVLMSGRVLAGLTHGAFGATPGLQLRVVGEARGAPYLASTLDVTAFNLGNAAGAFLGGLLIAGSGRLAPAAWAGAAMTASAVIVTVLAARGRSAHRGLARRASRAHPRP